MKEAAATTAVEAGRGRVAQSEEHIEGTGKKGGLVGFGKLHQPCFCLHTSSNPCSEHTGTQGRSPGLILTEIRGSIWYKQ